MRIVEIWSLKRGIIYPPEPIENSEAIEFLWQEQDNPEEVQRVIQWREAEAIRSAIASGRR
jgi:hypothetical protein